MDRKRYLVLCALTIAGAFAGGYAANRGIPVAHAQNLPATEVRGTQFVLTDNQGRTQATLRNGISGAELTFNDPQGNTRVEISPSRGLIIRDPSGHITWRSPRGSGILPLSAEGSR